MSALAMFRLLFVVLLLPLGLAACSQSGTEILPIRTSSANAGSPEQLKQKLAEQCVQESGDTLGIIDKTAKQCACFADTMIKAMSKDDLAFFANYSVVPTLSRVKPDDVKKRCGLVSAADAPARSRGWQKKSESN